MSRKEWLKIGGVTAGATLLFLSMVQAAGEPLVLLLSQPQGPIMESTVSLKVTMTNAMARELTVVKSNPGCDFKATVKDSDGRDVGFTAAGRELQQCGHRMLLGRRIIVKLKPGESTEDTYPLSWYYEVTKPGTYSVKLEREIASTAGGGISSSNEVSLQMVQ